MESVSSDASVKATQAVKFPLPDGNYSNYGVVKILCKYPCFCVILLLPSRGRWEKLEGTTSWPAVLRREFFFHFRLVFCHFVVILNSTIAMCKNLGLGTITLSRLLVSVFCVDFMLKTYESTVLCFIRDFICRKRSFFPGENMLQSFSRLSGLKPLSIIRTKHHTS